MAEFPRKPKGKATNLNARQDAVAAMLATGKAVAAAAREQGVHEGTVWGWMKKPAFRQRIEELRRELVDRAIGRLSDMMAGAAADRLLKLLDAKSENVQLDSVKAVYDLFINVTNASDLKARIEALEGKGK